MILFILTALLLVPLAALHAAPSAKPNILFILADDMGYGDVGAKSRQSGLLENS